MHFYVGKSVSLLSRGNHDQYRFLIFHVHLAYWRWKNKIGEMVSLTFPVQKAYFLGNPKCTLFYGRREYL
jgi:hypothetical protein